MAISINRFLSCLDPDLFNDDDYSQQDNVKLGAKRSKSCRERQAITYKSSDQNLKYGILRRLIRSKYVGCFPSETPLLMANANKIEVLCQDSGIRGCWFKCMILQVSRRRIRVQYDDVKDEDGSGNLEEWIPAFRLAMPDKFGMRHKGRPLSHNKSLFALEGGAPVDAWWNDGWWEGVLIGVVNSEDGILQVYVPSENVFLNVHGTNLRASKDWVGSLWVDIETNATIISVISAAISRDTKLSTISNIDKEAKSDDFPISSHEALINAAMPTRTILKRRSLTWLVWHLKMEF